MSASSANSGERLDILHLFARPFYWLLWTLALRREEHEIMWLGLWNDSSGVLNVIQRRLVRRVICLSPSLLQLHNSLLMLIHQFYLCVIQSRISSTSIHISPYSALSVLSVHGSALFCSYLRTESPLSARSSLLPLCIIFFLPSRGVKT